MTRWRRPGADEILLVYLLLYVVGFTWDWLAQPLNLHDPLPWLPVTAFLTWRVSRGGRVSRMILIVLSGLACAAEILAVARLWDLSVLALVLIYAAQVALLTSLPVYGRTRRPASIPVRARSWSQLMRRPPLWILPWGLLAGVLVTLATVGNMDWTAIAGCRPSASDNCTALVEGYPLRWLTADQNDPLIFKGALLKDCVQWALLSMSVLYLAWRQMPPADLSE